MKALGLPGSSSNILPSGDASSEYLLLRFESGGVASLQVTSAGKVELLKLVKEATMACLVTSNDSPVLVTLAGNKVGCL